MKLSHLFPPLAAASLAMSAPAVAQVPVAPQAQEPTDLADLCVAQQDYERNGVLIHETLTDPACFRDKTETVDRICKSQFTIKSTADTYVDCLNETARRLYHVDRYTNGQLEVWVTTQGAYPN